MGAFAVLGVSVAVPAIVFMLWMVRLRKEPLHASLIGWTAGLWLVCIFPTDALFIADGAAHSGVGWYRLFPYAIPPLVLLGLLILLTHLGRASGVRQPPSPRLALTCGGLAWVLSVAYLPWVLGTNLPDNLSFDTYVPPTRGEARHYLVRALPQIVLLATEAVVLTKGSLWGPWPPLQHARYRNVLRWGLAILAMTQVVVLVVVPLALALST